MPTLFDVPNQPKKITPSRPPPKKRSIQVPSTSACVKIAPTDYGDPPMPSKKTPTTKPSQLSPKKQFLRKKNPFSAPTALSNEEKIRCRN